MSSWKVFFWVLAFMVPASLCAALEDIRIDADMHSLPLGPHLEYLPDPDRNLTLDEVRARAGDFAASTVEVPNPGYTFAGYWMRFRLSNAGAEPLSLFLEFSSRFADHLRLYAPDTAGGYSVTESGRMVLPPDRPHPSREFVFPLQLPPDSSQVFYFYADSADTLTLPLYLHTTQGLSQANLNSHAWLMFYQGLVFAMTVFSLFLLATVRDRVYLYYILAIVVHHGLFFALFDGFGYRYFGLEAPWWSREALSVFVCLSMALIMQFSRVLMNTPRTQPRLDRLILTLQWTAGVTAVLSIFIDYGISIRIANPIASSAAMLMWAAGWNGYRRGSAVARYYLLAWTFVIIGGLTYSLKSWGLLPSNFFTEYGWQMGSAVEALLLSMAIAERINVEVRRRERSQLKTRAAQAHALEIQRRANETLEQRVRQRTEELEAANRKLEFMSFTDGLTGLHNRRYLEQRLDIEWKRATREQDMLAVMLLDIDRFKQFNDNFGHLVGDECLRKVAQAVKAQLYRDTDLVARYGGEEFCVLLPKTDARGALHIAERIRAGVESLGFTAEGKHIPVTISVGLAVVVPSPGQNVEGLLEVADEALYQSKRDGRNRVTLVDAGRGVAQV